MKNAKRFIGMATTICFGLTLASGLSCAKAFAAAKEVKIGFALSMTGGAAAYGATQKEGAQLAVDQINAAAGANGLKIKAIFEDDASSPQQGVNVFNKLISGDKVAMIIGPTLSNTAKVTDRMAQQAGVPVMGISNTAPGITEIGNYVFRDSLTEAVVIPHTIEVAKKKFGLHKVAVLYGNDDAFTKGGYVAFMKALKDNGIQVLTEQTFAKGDRDFSAQLTQIKSMNPDAIIVSALVEEATGIVLQARQLGISVPIVGGNGFNSPALIKNAGSAAEGVLIGAAWIITSPQPLNKKFVADFTAKYGNPPGQFAAQAFAGVHIAYEAIKKAGSTDHQTIRDALTKTNLETVLGNYSFTAGRDAGYTPIVQIVKNGKFVLLGE
jgi:branched-chain amino acid transport system substrate-binding protein